jgi:hypothetical protein
MDYNEFTSRVYAGTIDIIIGRDDNHNIEKHLSASDRALLRALCNYCADMTYTGMQSVQGEFSAATIEQGYENAIKGLPGIAFVLLTFLRRCETWTLEGKSLIILLLLMMNKPGVEATIEALRTLAITDHPELRPYLEAL